MNKRHSRKIVEDYLKSKLPPEKHAAFRHMIKHGDPVLGLRPEMKKDWETIFEEKNDVTNKSLNHVLSNIHHRINIEEKKQRAITRVLQVYRKFAAVIFIPLLLGSILFGIQYFNTNPSFNSEAWVEINSPAGARTNFQLPDGSIGWLNSNSTLLYPMNFERNREVKLDGEAYFDVIHNKRRKFVVQASGIDVNVHGTEFNVTNYENEDIIEVALQEGSVSCLIKGSGELIKMKPNQLFSFSKPDFSTNLKNVEAAHYTSWKDGIMILRDVSMDQLIKKIKRWYDVEIEIIDEELYSYTFWGGVFHNERLESIFEILKLSSPIDFSIKEREKMPDGTFSKKKISIYLKE